MIIITLTPQEEKGVVKTFETWANQTIDAQAMILKAAEYTNAQIKKALQLLVDSL